MGTRSRKLKRITAVMLSVSLLVTGINFNITSYAATENQQLEKNEIQLTEKDKNEARKQDKKIKKELKKTKDSKKNNKKATIIKEIEELRTANSTTYLLSDGSRKLEICGENIRFKENGKFVDYDSKWKKVSKQDEKSLKKDISDKSVEGKYAFVNKSGDAKNYFPKKLDEDSSIVLTKDKYSISFSPVINEKVDVKKDEENIGFLRVQTNEELTEAWLGTAAILPPYQGKGYGSEGLCLLEEEFSTVRQWDLCTVLQDAGMVAFYEKNGYHQTHIEPEKEGMDMVYMKKLIDK